MNALPYRTKTVEEKNALVNDKLKPTAEMHILVGGPYTDVNKETHRYGHTALRVRNSKLDVTYDFGRYGKVSGTFGESGDGILQVWTSFHMYISQENALHRETVGFMYQIFDHQVSLITKYFDDLIRSGKKIPHKSRSGLDVYKLAINYHALGPNCTTLSIDGAKAAVPKIDVGSEKFNIPEDVLNFTELMALKLKGGATRLFMPANLQKFLSSATSMQYTKIHTYK